MCSYVSYVFVVVKQNLRDWSSVINIKKVTCFDEFCGLSTFLVSTRVRWTLSREKKRRRKFSTTGERAPGMVLLTNQFHDSFECLSLIGHKKYICCPIGGQNLSRCFHHLLMRWSSAANSTFRLYLSGCCRRAFFREEFSDFSEKCTNWRNQTVDWSKVNS